jgi:hypothetical protein
LHQEIEGPYFPGHLIGDTGFLCVRQSETRVRLPALRSSPNQLVLRVVASSASSRGVRIAFEHDASALVSESEFEQLRGEDRLAVEIRASAIYFL